MPGGGGGRSDDPGASAPSAPTQPPAPARGLRADWFDLFSDLEHTRVDATVAIDHDDKTPPAPGVRGSLYSVRWSGTLKIDTAGKHTFFATADDGVRLFIDDKVVFDDWSSHPPRESSGVVDLTAGDHPIRLEFYQELGGARLAFEWQPPNGARGLLPEALLTPAAEAAGAARGGPRPTFANPVVPFDCPDPGILAVQGEHLSFFMVCTGGAMPVRRSDDLVHWANTTAAILPFGKASWSANGDRNWAPEIHKVGNKYVAYYTAVNGANRLSIGAASAPSPEGPFVDRGSPLVEHPQGVIDATFFEDSDGKRYLYYKIDGNAFGQPTPIFVRELAADGLSFAPGSQQTQVLTNDPGTWEGGVVEAPWVIEHDGEYFLFYSGNVYDHRYREGVAKAKSPKGPFTKKGAPILGNGPSWVGPGHGSVVQVHGRDYLFHHAWPALPNGMNDAGKGRHGLIAPITWSGGWPVLGDGRPVTTPVLWP